MPEAGPDGSGVAGAPPAVAAEAAGAGQGSASGFAVAAVAIVAEPGPEPVERPRPGASARHDPESEAAGPPALDLERVKGLWGAVADAVAEQNGMVGALLAALVGP